MPSDHKVVALVGLGLAMLSVTDQTMAQPLGEVGMIEVAVAVELTCPSCAQGLERRLSRLDHVARVEILGEEGRVVLGLEPGTSVALETVRDVIRNAGFMPTGFAVTAVGRLVEMNGATALALPDDMVFLLAGDQVDALGTAAGADVVHVHGAVSLPTGGGVPVLTIGQVGGP